jgi:hypothetical protein
MTVNRPSLMDYGRRPPPVAAGVLMALAAAAFAIVSIVHFGVDIPVGFATISDSFPGAAPPEAVIAAVMAIGASAVFARRTTSRAIGLGTALFALLGTAYGLTITLDSTRTGDVAYHLGILATLLIILGLLLVPGGRRVP